LFWIAYKGLRKELGEPVQAHLGFLPVIQMLIQPAKFHSSNSIRKSMLI